MLANDLATHLASQCRFFEVNVTRAASPQDLIFDLQVSDPTVGPATKMLLLTVGGDQLEATLGHPLLGRGASDDAGNRLRAQAPCPPLI